VFGEGENKIDFEFEVEGGGEGRRGKGASTKRRKGYWSKIKINSIGGTQYTQFNLFPSLLYSSNFFVPRHKFVVLHLFLAPSS
jgi:hypothetical protein